MDNTYKDFVIKAVFEEDSEGNVVINTPFTRYREEVWVDGVNVSNAYSNRKDLLGKTCVVFTQAIENHPTLPSEVDKAEKYENTLGISKVDVLAKAQPITTVDAEGKETVKAPTLKAVDNAALLAVNFKEPIKAEPIIEEGPVEELEG